ncbi:TetR/AcrR family transcriptional regulator [Solirubrobacter phytolaccae]|uniref:TetR/AcrR family transcriptional regulator n=1 Tax=Solirubrobacter phytolaccae TaxID=1404360 RepID=A0A9X3NCW3_9ACTN|nr:TetR/AcrR family transcriptional regulator [Solirubrobacter phytolaccae]MDA0182580.1 TetR/AcrR family transcriptional regulator [Solirubrobacter phytolaccae]
MSALPVFNAEPPERADAARNRKLVLEAAGRLFARNPECVTMEAVAAEAGVGKGTVFRRFGDRAGLVRALISDTEIQLQEDLIRGAPPLGPGAPARERLIAFGAAYLRFLEVHGRLLATAEGASWLLSEPYALYRTHVSLLLEQAGCGDSAQYLADVLMAPLAAPAFLYQRDVRERSLEELTRAYEDLVARLID